MNDLLLGVTMGFALLPCLLYAINVMLLRPPPWMNERGVSISVLIPARNEELAIRACVESVLASRGVELECIVLDDHSSDRTAEMVRTIQLQDGRVRLESALPLPEGWSGKQHACYALSKLATKPLLCFLDADVRLAPDGLARMAAFQHASRAALVSGFPRQETGTLTETLAIPLIHFVLLGYLPFLGMRYSGHPAFGAGCGQWFLTTRSAYDVVGGHEAVKASFHDGVKLPRAYRAKGLHTDLCDVTMLATCRMYRSAFQVWNGFAKNAREGLGSPLGIGIWTVLLIVGSILPWILIVNGVGNVIESRGWTVRVELPVRWADELFFALTIPACVVPILVRFHAAWRFRQSWLSALLHPLGIALLLGIQWYATVRAWLGNPVGWKGRPHPKDTT